MAQAATKPRGIVANAVSALLARTGLANVLGMQMNGNRDMYRVFGWKRRLVYNDFVLKYRRQAVARRIVNGYPDALWADPPQIQGDAAFQTAWQDLLAYMPVFSHLQKLDKLCRLGRYAVLVVGLDDGKPLDTPVSPVRDATKASRRVIYMQPYAEGSAFIKAWETDTKSPRFGLPTMYQIQPGQFDVNQQAPGTVVSVDVASRTFMVHWTRILHVAENALETPIYGSSALEAVYNDLDDLEKVAGGSSEMFWLNSNRGLHIDVDKDVEMDPKDASALTDEITEYTNELTRVIRTRGVKVNSLGADYFDATNSYDVCMSNIAAGTGYPKRVLMGSEAGQLASQQDRANWAQRVEERISEYGNPIVLMPLLRTLIDCQVLPKPTTMTVSWPDAFKMNPLERAQTSAQMARSAANLSKMMFTVQQLNHANAVDSLPTTTVLGGVTGTGEGSLSTNAKTDPSKSTSGSAKTPSGAPSDASSKSSSGDGAPVVQTVENPPLFDKKPPMVTLLTEEECRQIIGFGKHMPVFDDSQDVEASGSQVDSSSSASSTGTMSQEK